MAEDSHLSSRPTTTLARTNMPRGNHAEPALGKIHRRSRGVLKRLRTATHHGISTVTPWLLTPMLATCGVMHPSLVTAPFFLAHLYAIHCWAVRGRAISVRAARVLAGYCCASIVLGFCALLPAFKSELRSAPEHGQLWGVGVWGWDGGEGGYMLEWTLAAQLLLLLLLYWTLSWKQLRRRTEAPAAPGRAWVTFAARARTRELKRGSSDGASTTTDQDATLAAAGADATQISRRSSMHERDSIGSIDDLDEDYDFDDILNSPGDTEELNAYVGWDEGCSYVRGWLQLDILISSDLGQKRRDALGAAVCIGWAFTFPSWFSLCHLLLAVVQMSFKHNACEDLKLFGGFRGESSRRNRQSRSNVTAVAKGGDGGGKCGSASSGSETSGNDVLDVEKASKAIHIFTLFVLVVQYAFALDFAGLWVPSYADDMVLRTFGLSARSRLFGSWAWHLTVQLGLMWALSLCRLQPGQVAEQEIEVTALQGAAHVEVGDGPSRDLVADAAAEAPVRFGQVAASLDTVVSDEAADALPELKSGAAAGSSRHADTNPAALLANAQEAEVQSVESANHGDAQKQGDRETLVHGDEGEHDDAETPSKLGMDLDSAASDRSTLRRIKWGKSIRKMAMGARTVVDWLDVREKVLAKVRPYFDEIVILVLFGVVLTAEPTILNIIRLMAAAAFALHGEIAWRHRWCRLLVVFSATITLLSFISNILAQDYIGLDAQQGLETFGVKLEKESQARSRNGGAPVGYNFTMWQSSESSVNLIVWVLTIVQLFIYIEDARLKNRTHVLEAVRAEAKEAVDKEGFAELLLEIGARKNAEGGAKLSTPEVQRQNLIMEVTGLQRDCMGFRLICYVLFTLVALNFENIALDSSTVAESGTPTGRRHSVTFVGVLHMMLIFRCIYADLTKGMSSRVWFNAAFLLDITVLCSRYAYQFPLIHEWLDEVHVGSWLHQHVSLSEIGVQRYEFTVRFVKFLPIIFCVYFSKLVVMTNVKIQTKMTKITECGRAQKDSIADQYGACTVESVEEECASSGRKRFCEMLPNWVLRVFQPPRCALIIVLVVLVRCYQSISVLSGIYFVLALKLLWDYDFSAVWGARTWKSLFMMASLASVLKYMLQFRFAQMQFEVAREAVKLGNAADIEWYGFVWAEMASISLWKMMRTESLVIVCCMSQGITELLDFANMSKKDAPQVFSIRALVREATVTGATFATTCSRWQRSLAYYLFDCICLATLDVVSLLLLTFATKEANLFGLICAVIVGVIQYYTTQPVVKDARGVVSLVLRDLKPALAKCFIVMVMLVLLWQYGMLVVFQQSNHANFLAHIPWRMFLVGNSTVGIEYVMAVNVNSLWVKHMSFIGNTSIYSHNYNPIWPNGLPTQDAEIAHWLSLDHVKRWSGVLLVLALFGMVSASQTTYQKRATDRMSKQWAKTRFVGDVDDFATNESDFSKVQFAFFRFADKVTFVAIFVTACNASTSYISLIYFGYMLWSLILLVREAHLTREAVRALRFFNFLDIFLQLCFQAPWFAVTPAEASCSVRTSVPVNVTAGVYEACLGWWRVLGVTKKDVSLFNGSVVANMGYPKTPLDASFQIYVWLLCLWHVVDSPLYTYVREFFVSPIHVQRRRLVKERFDMHALAFRQASWHSMQESRNEATDRLGQIVMLVKRLVERSSLSNTGASTVDSSSINFVQSPDTAPPKPLGGNSLSDLNVQPQSFKTALLPYPGYTNVLLKWTMSAPPKAEGDTERASAIELFDQKVDNFRLTATSTRMESKHMFASVGVPRTIHKSDIAQEQEPDGSAVHFSYVLSNLEPGTTYECAVAWEGTVSGVSADFFLGTVETEKIKAVDGDPGCQLHVVDKPAGIFGGFSLMEYRVTAKLSAPYLFFDDSIMIGAGYETVLRTRIPEYSRQLRLAKAERVVGSSEFIKGTDQLRLKLLLDTDVSQHTDGAADADLHHFMLFGVMRARGVTGGTRNDPLKPAMVKHVAMRNAKYRARATLAEAVLQFERSVDADIDLLEFTQSISRTLPIKSMLPFSTACADTLKGVLTKMLEAAGSGAMQYQCRTQVCSSRFTCIVFRHCVFILRVALALLHEAHVDGPVHSDSSDEIDKKVASLKTFLAPRPSPALAAARKRLLLWQHDGGEVATPGHKFGDESSTSKFGRAGDRVEAKCKGTKKFFAGRICADNRDGTYDVKFDDGERDRAVPKGNIKSKAKACEINGGRLWSMQGQYWAQHYNETVEKYAEGYQYDGEMTAQVEATLDLLQQGSKANAAEVIPLLGNESALHFPRRASRFEQTHEELTARIEVQPKDLHKFLVLSQGEGGVLVVRFVLDSDGSGPGFVWRSEKTGPEGKLSKMAAGDIVVAIECNKEVLDLSDTSYVVAMQLIKKMGHTTNGGNRQQTGVTIKFRRAYAWAASAPLRRYARAINWLKETGLDFSHRGDGTAKDERLRRKVRPPTADARVEVSMVGQELAAFDCFMTLLAFRRLGEAEQRLDIRNKISGELQKHTCHHWAHDFFAWPWGAKTAHTTESTSADTAFGQRHRRDSLSSHPLKPLDLASQFDIESAKTFGAMMQRDMWGPAPAPKKRQLVACGIRGHPLCGLILEFVGYKDANVKNRGLLALWLRKRLKLVCFKDVSALGLAQNFALQRLLETARRQNLVFTLGGWLPRSAVKPSLPGEELMMMEQHDSGAPAGDRGAALKDQGMLARLGRLVSFCTLHDFAGTAYRATKFKEDLSVRTIGPFFKACEGEKRAFKVWFTISRRDGMLFYVDEHGVLLGAVRVDGRPQFKQIVAEDTSFGNDDTEVTLRCLSDNRRHESWEPASFTDRLLLSRVFVLRSVSTEEQVLRNLGDYSHVHDEVFIGTRDVRDLLCAQLKKCRKALTAEELLLLPRVKIEFELKGFPPMLHDNHSIADQMCGVTTPLSSVEQIALCERSAHFYGCMQSAVAQILNVQGRVDGSDSGSESFIDRRQVTIEAEGLPDEPHGLRRVMVSIQLKEERERRMVHRFLDMDKVARRLAQPLQTLLAHSALPGGKPLDALAVKVLATSVKVPQRPAYFSNAFATLSLLWATVKYVSPVLLSCFCIVAFIQQADILSVIYPMWLFGVVLVDEPRRVTWALKAMLRYAIFCVCFRTFFQLPWFCFVLDAKTRQYTLSIAPQCPSTSERLDCNTSPCPIQTIFLYGVRSFDGTAADSFVSQTSLLGGVQWDIYILICLCIYRNHMHMNGTWDDVYDDDEDTSFRTELHAILGALHAKRAARAALAVRHGMTASDAFGVARDQLLALVGTNRTALSEAEYYDKIKGLLRVIAGGEERDTRVDISAETKRLRALLDGAPSMMRGKRGARNGGGTALRSRSCSKHLRHFAAELPPRAHAYFANLGVELRATWPFIRSVKPPKKWVSSSPESSVLQRAKPGRSFYVHTSFTLLVTLMYVIFVSALVWEKGTGSSFSAQLSKNQFSASLVWATIGQLVLLSLERISQQLRSTWIKLLTLYSVIVAQHVQLWQLHESNGAYLWARPAVVIYYLLWCMYMGWSALQIRHGYPAFEQSFALTSKGYSPHWKWLHQAFMVIPFAFEAKAFLDWLCAKTSLDVFMFLQIEEIYSRLYINACNMQYRYDFRSVLFGSKGQPPAQKAIFGLGPFLVIAALLVGPMLMFSTASPVITTNAILEAAMHLELRGVDGYPLTLWDVKVAGAPHILPDATQTRKANVDAAETNWLVQVQPDSRTNWAVPLPTVDRITAVLNTTGKCKEMTWALNLKVVRIGPTQHKEITWANEVPLSTGDDDVCQQLAVDLHTASASASSGDVSFDINIPEAYESVVYLSAGALVEFDTKKTSEGALLQPSLQGLQVSFNKRSGHMWWTVTNPSGADDIFTPDCSEKSSAGKGLCMFVVTAGFTNFGDSLGLSSYGVVATYIFILGTVAYFFRLVTRGTIAEIIYREMPNTRELINLCEGIYLARMENIQEALQDEVRLFETLIKLFRSPDLLLQLCGSDCIHSARDSNALNRFDAEWREKLKQD